MIDADQDEDEAISARFDEIRKRFVAGLPERLAAGYDALPHIEGKSEASAVAVVSLYNAVHEIIGLAPMLGMAAIGQTARAIDNALVAAFRAGRGLMPGEAERIPPLLETLQVCAQDIVTA